jgi:hypothetical protein
MLITQVDPYAHALTFDLSQAIYNKIARTPSQLNEGIENINIGTWSMVEEMPGEILLRNSPQM